MEESLEETIRFEEAVKVLRSSGKRRYLTSNEPVLPYYVQQKEKTPQQEGPIVIEDYNLGRTTGVLGFFDPEHPNFIVIGKYLSPEERQNTAAHEYHHWQMHKSNAPQREHEADSYAARATGINGIRYQMHLYGVDLRNAA